MSPRAALLALATCAPHLLYAANLTAGPMVGGTDMHGTTIWVQTDSPAKVEIDYWVAQDVPLRAQRSGAVQLQAAEDNAARLRIENLQAGTRYAYRLRLDGQVVGNVQHFQTQVRWQWKNLVEPPNFTALMGSCHYLNEPARDRDGAPFGSGFGIFSVMAEKKPDLMLWLGDNSYLRENEWTSAEGIRYRFKADRAQPELQPLLRVGQHAAIWDDHDYGPDDSNSAFPLKQASLEMFKRYWANDSWGLPETPGIFGTFSFSDVDFFLLDNRWYRDADKDQARPDKRMLGEQQLRWLKNAMLMSTAPFKVVVGGSQFLANVSPRNEGWSRFPKERQDFMDWLLANRMDGVLFLSGDRHFTELTKLERPGAYPLFDLTCSPLTAGAFNGGADSTRPDRVPGTMVPVRNFCSLSVEGRKAERVITLKSFDATGKELWSHQLPAQALRMPRP
jgi:alkaline phosphatase D